MRNLTDVASKTFYTESAVSEMMKSFNLSDFVASICFQWPFITLHYSDGALNVIGLSRSSYPKTITTAISLNCLKYNSNNGDIDISGRMKRICIIWSSQRKKNPAYSSQLVIS